VNAFFIRNDVTPSIPALEVGRGYRAPKGIDVDDVFVKIEQAGLPLVTIDAAGAVA
jgi:hypothetical protein